MGFIGRNEMAVGRPFALSLSKALMKGWR